MKIGICIIAYNRLKSLKCVLNSLERSYYNEAVTLIISIDKSNDNTVKDYADQYEWKHGKKIIIAHPENLGLRKHVLKCGDLLYEYDALIVLEDDVSVAPSFYYYAKQCVERFYDDNNIAGISLYNFPLNYQNRLPFFPLQSDSDVYLMQCAQSWGQVWMKKQWFAFKNWYEQHLEEFIELPHLPKSICCWPKSSWLKYHTRYCIEQNKYFVYPYVSLSTNNSEAGTHNITKTTYFQTQLLFGLKDKFKLTPSIYYDGFFENPMIAQWLGYNPNDICIDFYGEKNNRLNNRYWLTRKQLSYKILRSYSLSYKPYELNIQQNEIGKELFLYDTQFICRNKFSPTERLFAQYFYNKDFGAIYFLLKKIKRLLKYVF